MSMSWIESSLTQLETRLRALFEGDGSRDGIPHELRHQLEQGLTLALKSGMRNLPKERKLDRWAFTAPDQYTITLHALQAQLLLNHPRELDRLTHQLESLASQLKIKLVNTPVLRVVADPQSLKVQVYGEYSHAHEQNTDTFHVHDELDKPDESEAGVMPKAFLIVNGLTTFPLTEPVINIGRDPVNQLLLEDERVSRNHAQLRLIQGHFVIFDLDSLGGTMVNGTIVTMHILNPGDVIQLAGVPLVYGMETADRTGYTQELPVDPPFPEVL